MALHAVENVEEAFGVTREFLTPINIRRWLKLALVVFFVGSGVSFPTAQFNTSTPPGDVSNGELPFSLPVDVMTLIVATRRRRNPLRRAVRADRSDHGVRADRVAPHGEVTPGATGGGAGGRALRLFGFRIAIGLPMIALFAGWLALLIVPILTGRDPTLPATAFLVGIPMVFLIGVLYALVSGLTTVFVVPLMIQADSGVLAAWRRLWGSIKTAWKQYLAYVVIAFLLTVAAGIIASIVVGIVAIVLLIPIHRRRDHARDGLVVVDRWNRRPRRTRTPVRTVDARHLDACAGPVVTYLRYYALLVLGDIEETFHILSDRQLSRREP